MFFDTALIESITSATPVWLAVVFLFVSYLGSVYVLGTATVVAYFWDDRMETATWIAILLGAYALFVFLKPITDLERPAVDPPVSKDGLPVVLGPVYEYAVRFESGSFPSGHAIAATVFYGLFVLDARISTRRRRLIGAIVVVALVGISRVALGLHFIEDILGGILIGLVFLAGMILLRNRSDSPFEVLLGVATILAAGAIVTGRPVDGATLLGAIGLAYLLHRVVDVRHRVLEGLSGQSVR